MKIHKSNDHSIFKKIYENRDIQDSEYHVKELIEEITDNNLLDCCPILVNQYNNLISEIYKHRINLKSYED